MRSTAAHTPGEGAVGGRAGYRGRADAEVFDDGHLRVEHRNYYVACGGERLALSRKEFLIISRLARGGGRWVGREELWASAWDRSAPFDANNLRVSVHYARRKLRRHGADIENDPGRGYRLAARPPSPDAGRHDSPSGG